MVTVSNLVPGNIGVSKQVWLWGLASVCFVFKRQENGKRSNGSERVQVWLIREETKGSGCVNVYEKQ